MIIFQERNTENSMVLGPNTAQKWQWLPLLGAKSLAPKFDFFSFSVLWKTVQNENFSKKCHNSFSKVCAQRTLYLKTKLIFEKKDICLG